MDRKSSGSGNPWSDHLRRQKSSFEPGMASPSSPSHSQPRRSSRMLLPLSSTGVSVPINVQSQMPHQQYYNSSNINESPPQVSHPYRMSAQAYADLSRSRSNSVQSLPKDELSDSSINSSPPSGGTTPVPPGRYQTVDHIPAATPRYPGQEVYSPNSASTGFRVSMDPASSAPSRRDTWASSYSGSHHGHTNSSPPPPLPQQRKLPLPGEPSPAYPTPITFHPDQAAQLPQLENSPPVTSSSTILAPPTLKLDLDFGSGSLFDDFSFGSLGLDSNTFSTPPPNVSPGPPASTTLASETPSREDEGKLRPDSVATQNTVTGGTEQEKSWLDPDSSPSTVTTGTFDHSSASISQNEWTTSTSADSSFAGAKAEEATSVALPASRPMSHLDLNSSSDSLSPERQLPAGAARVPIASPSGGPSQHSTLHSRHTSEDKSHLPPPRGSSMARSTSPQDTNRSQHVRKSSKESVGSSVLSINRSKTSLQSPTSPTIRSSIRSATPDTTPEPSSQAPSNSLHRPLSNLALNKNLPPPPPPGQMDVEASMHSAETSTSSLARSLLRKPTGPRELDQHTSESPRVPPPETNGLPPRPNTAPQNTSSPHQKKNSLLGNSSAASHLINRSKGLLHRSTSSVASSIQSELPVHQSVADIDGSSPQADKCFPRNTRSSLANYFNSQPGRPTSSSLSSLAAQAEPSEPPPSHQPQSRPVLGSNRRDSGDSTTSEEFGAANLVSMSTARRDVERRIERQKELEAKEKTKEMEKERHSRKHVSSKPPPPVDLDESSKRPSTDKLLALASAKLEKFAASRLSSVSSTSNTSTPKSSSPSSGGASPIPVEEHFSVTQAVRVTRPPTSSLPHSGKSNGLPLHIAEGAVSQSNKAAFVLADAPKVIQRRQAFEDTAKALEGDVKTDSPAADLKKPPHLELKAGGDSTAPPSASPLKTAVPKSPQPPPMLWEKRRLPIIAADQQDLTGWTVLGEAYEQYADALEAVQQDRHTIVQASLLPFLKQIETGAQRLSDDVSEASQQRDILFKWINLLVEELKGVPANRGTCLDGVAATLESTCFAPEALLEDQPGVKRFQDTLIAVLSFAIEKLNEKAVYANTLSFSGRLMAVAFFRIEGVGKKLLRLLPPVKRQDLKRVLTESGVGAFVGRSCPPLRMDLFPEHLRDLCFQGLQSYSHLLVPLAPAEDALLVESDQHAVRMHGNWLIRWQASDSDLPFAFYRAYHRQLSAYLQPPDSLRDQSEAYVSPYEAISAPGFLFIAASLLEKIDSLIHRNLRSVTTLGPSNNNFSSNDSANMSMGTKPKVLEHLNRRVVSTIQDIVGGPARPQPDPEPTTYEGLGRRRFFGGMLQVWMRALVKRTSLYDARGVFLLFDFIEGLFYTVCTQVPTAGAEPGPWHPSADALCLFDVPFILGFVKTILNKADNTIELMRTITFLYSQFETQVFTLRQADRYELCQKILLYPETFQRMFLFWNVSVRGYFLRLLVWRVSRLGTSHDGRPMDIKDPNIIAILQMLNSRLEGLRKRHDEIDPLEDLPDDGLFDATRASVSSTRGVTNQSWFSEELLEGKVFSFTDDDYESDSDLSDDGTLHTATVPAESSSDIDKASTDSATLDKPSPKENAKISKVVNWLKVLKPNKRVSNRSKSQDGNIEPFGISLDKEDADLREPTISSSLQDPEANSAAIPPAIPRKQSTPPLSEQDDATEHEPFPLVGNPAANDNNFFKFEFESSTPVSDHFEGKSKRSTKAASIRTNRTSRTSNSRRASMSQSPRVSKRFSKRASILPPPALDLLLESSEPVPRIPKEFQNPPPYAPSQHPYAVRSLREYEDALDEFDVWIARVQEDDEDLEGREQNELIPRLSLLWPLSFSESD